MERAPKILAIKLREIGDTVIWTAALRTLRAQLPLAEIHVLTYDSNRAALKLNPDLNQVHFLKSHSRWELMRKLWSLRAERFNWLLGFNANTSLCRWAWLAGAEKMALHHFSRTSTPQGSVKVPHAGELEDAITRDYRLLEAMGLNIETRHPTRIWLAPAETDGAELRLREVIQSCGGDITLPRYLFLPGARHALHRYPKDLWLPLAAKVTAQGQYQPVVLVDSALSEELNLREECARLNIPLIDRGSLREFIALVSRGERAFANDSAPSHIAVALGLKTAMVFGPGCPGDWHPYDREQNPLLYAKVSCRARGPRDREQFQFCTLEVCSHHRCMRELKVHL